MSPGIEEILIEMAFKVEHAFSNQSEIDAAIDDALSKIEAFLPTSEGEIEK